MQYKLEKEKVVNFIDSEIIDDSMMILMMQLIVVLIF